MEIIEKVARAIDPECFDPEVERVYGEVWAFDKQDRMRRVALAAIEAYRDSADDPVTSVYGRLVFHVADAVRKGDSKRRKRAIEAADALMNLWPAECKIWEDRYTLPPEQPA